MTVSGFWSPAQRLNRAPAMEAWILTTGPPGNSQSILLLSLEDILAFYCCITNYHKFCSRNQHPLIISQFLTVRRLGKSLSLYLGSHNQGVAQDAFSSGGFMGEGSPSKLTQIIGKIHSLSVTGLRDSDVCSV